MCRILAKKNERVGSFRRTVEQKEKCGNSSSRLMRWPTVLGNDDRDLRICRVVHEFKRSRD